MLIKMYPQSVIALDMVSHRVGTDNVTEGPIAELKICARVGECSQTDHRVSVENGRMLNVV
jgi:hypothetical protein